MPENPALLVAGSIALVLLVAGLKWANSKLSKAAVVGLGFALIWLGAFAVAAIGQPVDFKALFGLTAATMWLCARKLK